MPIILDTSSFSNTFFHPAFFILCIWNKYKGSEEINSICNYNTKRIVYKKRQPYGCL